MPAPPPLGEEAIRQAALKTLRQWPGAEAAILFGSRARGDHRPDSDWDIAIVTSRGDERDPADTAPRRLECDCKVQILPLTRERLRRKCNAPGHVGFDIARQGRLPVGRWQSPPLMKNAHMQPEEFRTWYDGACSHLAQAATKLVEVATMGRVVDARAFVAATADAAEHLVKGMICRHTGRPPSRTHQVDVLAEELPEHFRSEAADPSGMTREHHVALYETAMPSDCRDAGTRAVVTLKMLVKELADARHDPGLAAMAEEVAGTLLRRVRGWPGALRVPADEEAIRDMIVLADEDVVLENAIAQRKPFADACDAAVAELERSCWRSGTKARESP